MLSDDTFNKIFSTTGFSKARPQLKYAINKSIEAYESGKKYVIVHAPTGIGKSGISYAIANYFGSAYFMTVQRILLEQYKNDFDMPTISSKKNYWCNRIPSCRCSTCIHSVLQLKICDDCPHHIAYKEAFENRFCSPNYSYMLAISGAVGNEELPQDIKKRNLVVCDECHLLESELISRGTCEIDINNEYKILNLCRSLLRLQMPNFAKMTEKLLLDFLLIDYLDFAAKKKQEAILKLGTFNKQRKDKRAIDEIKRLSAVKSYYVEKCCHISDMKKYAFPDVVVTNNNASFCVKPLFAKGFFHSLLTRFGERFLFMSATILDKSRFCKELSINEDDCEYIELDSEFPLENRPIYFWPSGSMNYKDKHNTYPLLCNDIEQILKKYPTDKGIIHCANYEVASIILNNLINSDVYDRFLFINAENKQEELKVFQESTEPYVLVSPSLSEGLDLKDDLSRLCIICKVPYASLADKWICKKILVDSDWYAIKTAETLIQLTGRSVRSKTDHADTYILDSEFLNFYNKNKKIFPKYWRESISFV